MSGSIRKCWIAGVTYNVKATADFSEGPDVETEGIRHSGGTLPKRENKVAEVDGIELIVDGVEKQTLREIARGQEKVPFGYEEEDGSTNDAEGWINIDSRTTMEATITIKFIPDGEWDVVAA